MEIVRAAPAAPRYDSGAVEICIYCRKEGGPATREHVMPQSFGKFIDCPVLYPDVCGECNQALGDTVEILAARGSLEGIRRFITANLASVSSIVKAPRGRVSYELQEPVGWEGVRAYQAPSPDGSSTVVMFEPQVKIEFKDGRPPRFILLRNLGDAELVSSEISGWYLYAKSDEEVDQLTAALVAKGLTARTTTPIPSSPQGDTVLMRCNAVYDDIVRRLMAKIAFNYLAWCMGAPFALKPEFDPIRRFIRYGEGNGSDLCSVTDRRFLQEERHSGNWSITDAHLVGVERTRNGVVLGHVSLFNQLHHQIRLADELEERIRHPGLPSGRIFFWESGHIQPLLAWPEENLVQPYTAVPPRLRPRRRGAR
jgi:hypothetical protein